MEPTVVDDIRLWTRLLKEAGPFTQQVKLSLAFARDAKLTVAERTYLDAIPGVPDEMLVRLPYWVVMQARIDHAQQCWACSADRADICRDKDYTDELDNVLEE